MKVNAGPVVTGSVAGKFFIVEQLSQLFVDGFASDVQTKRLGQSCYDEANDWGQSFYRKCLQRCLEACE